MRLLIPATASVVMTDCHTFADPLTVVGADCVLFDWNHAPIGWRLGEEATVVEDPGAVVVGCDAR